MKGVGEAHNVRSGLDIDLYIQFDQSSVTMYLNIFLILILKSIKWNYKIDRIIFTNTNIIVYKLLILKINNFLYVWRNSRLIFPYFFFNNIKGSKIREA